MASEEITVTPYNGALLTTQLLSAQQTIVLGDFGSETTGTLIDKDGLLSSADDGTTLFNGEPISFIGSGTATPGVDVLGLIVPLGSPVDVVVFEAGTQVYFYYPAGEPNLLGAVALVVDIDKSAYQVFTPICFAEGTEIMCPEGPRKIELLKVGEKVSDINGRPRKVLWIGKMRLNIPYRSVFRKWLPVRISAGAFGQDQPYRDTWLSQQHRILVRSPMNELYFGHSDCLVPAVTLTNNSTVRIDTAASDVTYYHILCKQHAVLSANGIAAESLHAGQMTKEAFARAAFREFDMNEDILVGSTAAPVLRNFEARLVAQSGIR